MNDESIDEIETVRGWLVDRLAVYLDREPEELNARTPLATYGPDSVYAHSIATELSERTGLVFETSELQKHNTIDKIVARLGVIAQRTDTTSPITD